MIRLFFICNELILKYFAASYFNLESKKYSPYTVAVPFYIESIVNNVYEGALSAFSRNSRGYWVFFNGESFYYECKKSCQNGLAPCFSFIFLSYHKEFTCPHMASYLF